MISSERDSSSANLHKIWGHGSTLALFLIECNKLILCIIEELYHFGEGCHLSLVLGIKWSIAASVDNILNRVPYDIQITRIKTTRKSIESK